MIRSTKLYAMLLAASALVPAGAYAAVSPTAKSGNARHSAASALHKGTAPAEQLYCAREGINSRIVRTFCKTAKQWDEAGSPLEPKDLH